MNANSNPAEAPAFPVPPAASSKGVTIRDWIAGMALQGLVSKGLEVRGDRVLSTTEKSREFAIRAYSLADAMLAARDGLPLEEPVKSEVPEDDEEPQEEEQEQAVAGQE